MKSKEVLIRLDEQTYTSLNLVAERLGVSRTEMLRTFLNQGLSGYDRKHEEVLDRMNRLEMSLAHSSELNAVTAAMVATLDQSRHSNSEPKKIRANVKQGISLIADGLLKQRQTISCTGVK